MSDADPSTRERKTRQRRATCPAVLPNCGGRRSRGAVRCCRVSCVGRVFPSSSDHGESWTTWAAKGTVGILHRFALYWSRDPQSPNRTAAESSTHGSGLRRPPSRGCLRCNRSLLAEAYRDGIFKSFDSIGNGAPQAFSWA